MSHRVIVYIVFLFFILSGCDLANKCSPKHVYINDFFVISPEGELIERVSYEDDSTNPLVIRGEGFITVFNNDLVFSRDYHKRIFNYKTGEIVFDLGFNPGPVSTSYTGNKFIYAEQTVESITVLENVELNNKRTDAKIIANEIHKNSFTSNNIVEVEGGVIDRDKFSSIRILAHDLTSDSETLYYVQEKDITKVSTDSARTQIYEDRYYYERSLWKYDFNTQEKEKLLILSNTYLGIDYFLLRVSEDGEKATYIDDEGIYFINLQNKEVEFNQGKYRNLDYTDDSRFLIYGKSGCSTSYTVRDFEKDKEWNLLGGSSCDSFEDYSIIPHTYDIVYLKEHENGPQIRKANIQSWDSESQSDSNEEELLYDIMDGIGVDKELQYYTTVSRAAVFPNGNIIFHVYFNGASKYCK